MHTKICFLKQTNDILLIHIFFIILGKNHRIFSLLFLFLVEIYPVTKLHARMALITIITSITIAPFGPVNSPCPLPPEVPIRPCSP